MRYHWGLGVGHVYSHQDNTAEPTASSASATMGSASSTTGQPQNQPGVSEEHTDATDEDCSVAIRPVDGEDSLEHSLENIEDDFLDVDDPRHGIHEDNEGLEDDVQEMLEEMFGPDEDDQY